MIAESVTITTAYGNSVKLTQRDMDRFWSTVNKNGPVSEYCPELGPCWIWTGAFFSNGYPRFNIRRDGRYFSLRGNRMAYIFSGGVFDDVKNYALHFCHDSRCVNPSHIRAGDVKENTADREMAGRSAGYANFVINHDQVRGESSAKAVLNDDKVREIRRLKASTKMTVHQIGAMFGVSGANVSAITRRKTWRHVE